MTCISNWLISCGKHFKSSTLNCKHWNSNFIQIEVFTCLRGGRISLSYKVSFPYEKGTLLQQKGIYPTFVISSWIIYRRKCGISILRTIMYVNRVTSVETVEAVSVMNVINMSIVATEYNVYRVFRYATLSRHIQSIFSSLKTSRNPRVSAGTFLFNRAAKVFNVFTVDCVSFFFSTIVRCTWNWTVFCYSDSWGFCPTL